VKARRVMINVSSRIGAFPPGKKVPK